MKGSSTMCEATVGRCVMDSVQQCLGQGAACMYTQHVMWILCNLSKLVSPPNCATSEYCQSYINCWLYCCVAIVNSG